MELAVRLIVAQFTGIIVAAVTLLSQPDRSWLHYLLVGIAAAVTTAILMWLSEEGAHAWFMRKSRRLEVTLRSLLAETTLDPEDFKSLSYHSAYVVLMHPGLTTIELTSRPSMKPHLGQLNPAQAEALLKYAGAYFGTADRFGQAADGTWWLARSDRSARQAMRSAAKSLERGRVTSPISPVAA